MYSLTRDWTQRSTSRDISATSFCYMRENVGHLVAQIAADMPGMTVHDLTHLDSLWETASLVAEGAITVSPPEGFVLGASILLHDSAMTVAAYPGRVSPIFNKRYNGKMPSHVAYSRRRRTDAAKSIAKIRPQKSYRKSFQTCYGGSTPSRQRFWLSNHG